MGGPACDTVEEFEGVSIDAITISGVQAALARNLCAGRGLQDSVRVHVADFHELPFADGAFDIVWFLESAEYTWNAARLFGEARRVLKRGGRLFQKGLFLREGQTGRLAMEHLKKVEQVWGIPNGLWRPSQARAAITAAGFRIEHSALLDGEVGMDRYLGAMIELGQQGRPRLNPFGRIAFLPYGDVPLCYAECRAVRID